MRSKSHTHDLFAESGKKRPRGRPPREQLQVPTVVVDAVTRACWWPKGYGCSDQAGRLMDALALACLRQREPGHIPPADAPRHDCLAALVQSVAVLKLVGVGTPGTTYGNAIDRAFANASRFLAKTATKAREQSR